MNPTFSIIAAVDEDFGIGKNGGLPWQLSPDMKHFKSVTATASFSRKNAVIMGRKTWDSLPPQFRPLPDRLNVVLSRQPNFKVPKGVLASKSLDEALRQLRQGTFRDSIDQIFVIGGEKIFREAIAHPACKKLYLTHILKSFVCDCFFPQENLSLYKPTQKSKPAFADSVEYFFAEYERI